MAHACKKFLMHGHCSGMPYCLVLKTSAATGRASFSTNVLLGSTGYRNEVHQRVNFTPGSSTKAFLAVNAKGNRKLASDLTEHDATQISRQIWSHTNHRAIGTGEIKLKGAKLDAIIDYARRVNDWPLLESAVDENTRASRIR
jgi:hypothetical protein